MHTLVFQSTMEMTLFGRALGLPMMHNVQMVFPLAGLLGYCVACTALVAGPCLVAPLVWRAGRHHDALLCGCIGFGIGALVAPTLYAAALAARYP